MYIKAINTDNFILHDRKNQIDNVKCGFCFLFFYIPYSERAKVI